MWGSDGTAAPMCRKSMPWGNLAAGNSRAEMNWLDALESIVTKGPPSRAGASMVKGSAAASMCTPSWARPSSSGAIGR